jgi:DNA processing protein
VLVVEAPEKSGALITARDAFEQGSDVFVVPGNIGVPACAGSNALMQELATAVTSGWDVLKRYADLYPDVTQAGMETRADYSRARVAQPVFYPTADKKTIDNPPISAYSDLDNNLTEQEKRILGCLSGSPVAVDDVIAKAGLPATEVLRILTALALKGVVINHPGRHVSVK